MSRTRSLTESFGFAFAGLKTAVAREPNFQIHLSVGVAVLLFAIILGFNKFEWLLLMFTISFVLILELVNTVLEAIVDLVSPDFHPKAKVAKDVSAAVVLLAAVISVIVGVALFLPKLITVGEL